MVVLKENEKKALEELKKALLEKFEILDLRLFGSKARGTSDPGSDLDVMIELPEGDAQIEAQIDNIIYKINLENDALISAVFFGEKEITEGPMSESPLFKVIQKEGVPI
jgi:predicted nucleotidyltransferase